MIKEPTPLDEAARIMAEQFSASVLRGLQEAPPRTFLYCWENDALEWLRRYRATGGDIPFCAWTGMVM